MSFGKAPAKLKVYGEARKKEISKGDESTPSIYPSAMNPTDGFATLQLFFCLWTTSFGKAPVISLRLRWGLKEGNFPRRRAKPSVYPFAMDTHGCFCGTYIRFLKKIAVVKFPNEPGSEPLLAWKRANWVQETCLLIQNVLRAASLYFHRRLRKCFANDYARFIWQSCLQ